MHSDVVVVGGGISGLATAHYLAASADRHHATLGVTLVEAADRLGGKVRTQRLAGQPVEAGPDSLLTRAPAVRDLLDRLGLASSVVAPNTSGAYVWSRRRLRRLPGGSVAAVAAHPGGLLRSGLLTPAGAARAGADLVLPTGRTTSDPSVAELLGRRFGPQVLHRLADPLLGGVHAGSVHRLSARSAVPELAEAASGGRSLWRGLRRGGGQSSTGASMVTLRGGLSSLIDALVADTSVLVGNPAVTVQAARSGYRVGLADGTELDADAVVLAVPAFAGADVLTALSPPAAAVLREIPYADVATVALAYPPGAVRRDADGTGFLVPSEEGLLTVGCSWLTAKWPHLAARSPALLLRAMVGRHQDRRFADLDDAELVARVHGELAPIMGLTQPPTESRVHRWPRAIPQYTVGHQDRLSRLDNALRSVPGLYVTGAAYRGVGLAGCIVQAAATAEAVHAGLAHRSGRRERSQA